MKVIGIEGSPREDGNTEKLVRAILAGAAQKGADTRFYKISKMNISPCRGCIGCRESGICVIQDEMTILYDEIQASDAIVLGSPIYMWQVTAQTKMLMDRLVVFVKPDFSSRLNGKKDLVLAFTQGNPDPQSFKFYFDYLEKLFSFMYYDVRGRVVAHGMRKKDDILDQKEVLERAREIGKSLVA
ncbi:flavodoxin family protein [Desulforhabdus amnigena]|jgi:multimeric flavodoxin WrbA|uniref:Flavodoxin family protein n=1 Tax=Desulforhabdus amnigena TaxID=40218 RepID=A0A9W6D1K6_9BACT|nr:flavodoxin family protein [Desulforhabdus amnigena]NLJ27301.1 flavodoxin family protein [Deltaproteobacteria bacterium]GLI32948.1 flavodoxin family protein [Desulforhabdus amnigena]